MRQIGTNAVRVGYACGATDAWLASGVCGPRCATAAIKLTGSAGLIMCNWYPASREVATSCRRDSAVNAIASH